MQATQRSTNRPINPIEALRSLWRTPGVTVARLTLESYFRSGWMWAEFVLVLVFFAALFFPYMGDVPYFYDTSIWDLSAIAILGTAIMVRQSTSARTYVLLARLSSRSAYTRGLMLATAVLRVPIFLFMLLLVLLSHRLTNPTVHMMLIGALGVLPTTMLVAVLTVTLSPPIATRLTRILFLCWVAIVLFSISPVFAAPAFFINVLSIVRIPLWPIAACYNMSTSGTIGLPGMSGLLLEGVYVVGLALIAGYFFERRELLLY